MSLYAKDEHKRAARILGYALTLDTVEGWWSFAQVIAARLTVKERTSLVFMAIQSLEYDDAVLAVEAALDGEPSQ